MPIERTKKVEKPAMRYVGKAIAIDGEVPEWIQIFPYGEWKGHVKKSFAIDENFCEVMMANFQNRGIDVVIDYEHQTEITMENGQPAPAAGWIDKLEVREDGLWGHVKGWTDRAEEMLEAKEYRYLSPVWAMNAADHATGKSIGPVLFSCALTNTPFFTELEPLVAKAENPTGRAGEGTHHGGQVSGDNKGKEKKQTIRGKEGVMDNDAFRSAMYNLLSLKEATDEDVLAKLQEMVAFVKTVQGIFGTGAETPEAVAASMQQFRGDEAIAGKVRELLKLDAKADEKEITAKLYPLIQPQDGMVSRQEFESLQATVKQTEAEKLVAKAMEEGKLTAAQRDWALRYAKDSPEGFQAWMAKAPAVVPLGGPKKETPGGDGSGGITEQQKLIAKQLGVDAGKVYGKKAQQG